MWKLLLARADLRELRESCGVPFAIEVALTPGYPPVDFVRPVSTTPFDR